MYHWVRYWGWCFFMKNLEGVQSAIIFVLRFDAKNDSIRNSKTVTCHFNQFLLIVVFGVGFCLLLIPTQIS